MEYEFIFSVALGIFSGIVVGILPGVSPSSMSVMCLPLLQIANLHSVFAWYFALMTTSQFFGSVSSIVYGVAGEISSMPAVVHGHKLFRQGQGAFALAVTSTGSFIAGLFGIICLYIINQYQFLIYPLIGTTYKASIYIIVILAVVYFSTPRILAFFMLMTGILIGKLGYDGMFSANILFDQHSIFAGGIPFFPLFIGFLIIPTLIQFMSEETKQASYHFMMPLKERIRYLVDFSYWPTMLRASALGSFVGLIPGASYVLASNLADTVEKKFNDTASHRLIAAETANNSGAITVLIPLLAFSIPIIPSEAIIVNIAETKGFDISSSIDQLTQNINFAMLVILVTLIVNWFIAGAFYQSIFKIYDKLKKYVYHIALILTLGLVTYIANTDNTILPSLIALVLASFVGYFIKNEQLKFLLIFGYIISTSAIDELYRAIAIHF